ncbi:Hypothetical protein CINCED_3A025492 [Cinara cedri]|uniref:Uncharacterized protein n=1 Tax=Cinara cedri TaxID=506608 RepID=A0A5E4NCL0_9HEMI|nr:Hypothetical protein CINCED_3A025492 [Cinara cedri]
MIITLKFNSKHNKLKTLQQKVEIEQKLHFQKILECLSHLGMAVGTQVLVQVSLKETPLDMAPEVLIPLLYLQRFQHTITKQYVQLMKDQICLRELFGASIQKRNLSERLRRSGLLEHELQLILLPITTSIENITKEDLHSNHTNLCLETCKKLDSINWIVFLCKMYLRLLFIQQNW